MNRFAHIAYAGLTDVGRKRKNNEDAFRTLPAAGIFCVADGMGGGDDGEIASAAVVKAADDAAARCAQGDEGGYAVEDVAEELETRLSEASSWIWKRAKAKNLSGCGSTFVGVVFDATAPGQALAVHAGDSRAYLIRRGGCLRGGTIRQITRDHSAEEMLGENGKMNPMFRGMIVNAVGIRQNVDCERTPFRVKPGDRVMVCSDGLTRMVPDKKILEISQKCASVEEAVKALIAAALEAGGVDNVTLVLCEVGKLPKALPRRNLPIWKPAQPDGDTSADSSVHSESNTATVDTHAFDQMEEKTAETKASEAKGSEASVPERRKGVTLVESRRTRQIRQIALTLLSFVLFAAAAYVFLRGKKQTVELPPPQPVSVTKPNVPKPPAPPVPVTKPNMPKASVEEGDMRAKLLAAITNVVNVKEERAPTVVASNQVGRAENAEAFSAALVEVCTKERVDAFVDTLRRLASEGEAAEFANNRRRFEESATSFRSSRRTAKSAQKMLTDFKYLLASVPSVRRQLSEKVPKAKDLLAFMRDWELAIKGDERDRDVQEACARMLKGVPEQP